MLGDHSRTPPDALWLTDPPVLPRALSLVQIIALPADLDDIELSRAVLQLLDAL